MDLPASTKVKTKAEIIPTKNLNKKSHMVYIYIWYKHLKNESMIAALFG